MRRATFLIPGLFVAMLIFVTACGGGDEATATSPKPTATSTSPTATGTTATSTSTCSPGALVITTPTDELKYDTDKLTVNAGDEVKLCYQNNSTVFQHNWVLVQAGAGADVAAAGTIAGPGSDWISTDDPRIIANTALLDPAEEQEVSFTVPGAGTYQFICTFPAHVVTMIGDFVVEP